MATYRGQDGSVSLATNVIGETTQWSFTTEFEILEDTVQGDVARTRKTGVVDWNGSFTARFDYGDTNGQKALLDLFTGGTPDGAVANVRFRVSATKYFSAAAVLQSMSIQDGIGGIVELTANVLGNGQYTITWS